MTGKSCVWKEECGAGSGVDKQSVTSLQISYIQCRLKRIHAGISRGRRIGHHSEGYRGQRRSLIDRQKDIEKINTFLYISVRNIDKKQQIRYKINNNVI